MSDQLIAQAATYTTHNKLTFMPAAGFEPAIPAIEQLETLATGIDLGLTYTGK